MIPRCFCPVPREAALWRHPAQPYSYCRHYYRYDYQSTIGRSFLLDVSLQSRALVCSFYIYLSNPLSSVFGWSTLKHLPIIFLLVTSELSHTGEFLCGSAWNNSTKVPQKCNCTDMPLYRFQNNYNAQYLHNTFCECLTHYSQSAFNNCRDIKL